MVRLQDGRLLLQRSPMTFPIFVWRLFLISFRYEIAVLWETDEVDYSGIEQLDDPTQDSSLSGMGNIEVKAAPDRYFFTTLIANQFC